LDGETVTAPVEVFWMPGCSSCLRLKEFMEQTELPYVEVNVASEPERAVALTSMGLGVPAVIVGSRGVPGLDLAAVADLVGFDYSAPEMLDPATLHEKYVIAARALLGTLGVLSDDQLDYVPADRDRSLRALSAHAGTIMRRFLEAYDGEFFADATDGPRNLSESGTRRALVEVAEQTLQDFERWWQEFGYDDPLDRVIETRWPPGWGHRTMQEVLERAVWHSAQHVRQLQHFAFALGVTVPTVLTDEDLAGLPIPNRVQA
jgi:glutaredoxin/uncharacterized damage-inducible protein DinB